MSEPCHLQKKSLIVFELNEFNEDLLETAAKQYDLKNILALLSYPKTYIRSSSATKPKAIHPAEQWESLHTGQKSNTHGVNRLGTQYSPQRSVAYWETLLAKHHTVGLWGVINAEKPKNKYCPFFLPDLWQSKKSAYPKALTPFISLPRYLTKNYPYFTPNVLIRKLIHFITFIKNSGMAKKISIEFIKLFLQLIYSAPRTLLFVCFYDLISCLLFTGQLKKNPVHLSLFFANSLAYLQHYYWKQGKWVTTAPLLHGLKIIDRMVGMLRQFEDTHHIILLNGLTQENRQHQAEQIIYKIKDPAQFFRYMALSPTSVDALSPSHGLVYFDNALACTEAMTILNQAKLGHAPLFIAKIVEDYPHALYYTISLNTVVTKDAFFELQGTEFRFSNYFKAIYTVTGKHHNQGVLYSQGITFPKTVSPELFSQYILNYYEPEPAHTPSPIHQVEYA